MPSEPRLASGPVARVTRLAPIRRQAPDMASCPYCGSPLAPGPPWAPGGGHRLAYDPIRGRLWNVCSDCSRWTLTPLDSRWETLEACEAAVQKEGRVRLSTAHLSLVEVGEGSLIRVGRPPRSELVDWRYGPKLVETGRLPSFWGRLFAKLPSPPVGGYDPYKGFEGAMRSAPWFASPFLDQASSLTYLFSQLPLAPDCPACHGPLALKPWDFQRIEFSSLERLPGILVSCALCQTEVTSGLAQARPALRIGLGLVTPPGVLRTIASGAAEGVDALGGPLEFLETLVSSRFLLGELDLPRRAGLIISLDEMAETEALEAEWREAEEMASIMDGELSDVPGFESFRQEILEQAL